MIMKYLKEKLFWKKEFNEKHFFFVEYDEQRDYYSFIKEMIDKKYYQTVITSDIMLEYIESIATIGNIYIDKIEMMEEDDEFSKIVEDIVSRCITNRGALIELVKMLQYLDEESSVDIKTIYLHEEHQNKIIMGYIQVNGIIGISSPNSQMAEALLRCVKECLGE